MTSRRNYCFRSAVSPVLQNLPLYSAQSDGLRVAAVILCSLAAPLWTTWQLPLEQPHSTASCLQCFVSQTGGVRSRIGRVAWCCGAGPGRSDKLIGASGALSKSER